MDLARHFFDDLYLLFQESLGKLEKKTRNDSSYSFLDYRFCLLIDKADDSSAILEFTDEMSYKTQTS